MKDQPAATPREDQVFGLSEGNNNRRRKVPRISAADKQDMVLPMQLLADLTSHLAKLQKKP